MEKCNIELASDKECANRRQQLINAGIIVENKSNLVTRSIGEVYVSTRKYAAILRENLEKNGLVSSEYFDIPSLPHKNNSTEEGEYRPTPIQNDRQYSRRQLLYFRMLQEILVSRRDLQLNLRPKQEGDPDWVF